MKVLKDIEIRFKNKNNRKVDIERKIFLKSRDSGHTQYYRKSWESSNPLKTRQFKNVKNDFKHFLHYF